MEPDTPPQNKRGASIRPPARRKPTQQIKKGYGVKVTLKPNPNSPKRKTCLLREVEAWVSQKPSDWGRKEYFNRYFSSRESSTYFMSWARDTFLGIEYRPFLLQNVNFFSKIMKAIALFIKLGEDNQPSEEAYHAATFLHGHDPNRHFLPMKVSMAEHDELVHLIF